ncbi:YbaB/EbfC family nucleoid-associated protein, partial [Allokutzneria albata]|uniref:YbaB/EbfC DNA-binding family protein n=1 Tax=Allokutzneria albata TaxID=211114 RepID=A0A1G9Z0U6_ALLAB
MTEEFDRLVEQFERFQENTRRAESRLADYDGMRERIADLEATAHSPGRDVTVTAGPGGSVKNIEFTDRALQQSPQALSATVMATLRTAVAAAARQQAAVVQEFVGDDMNVLDQVLQTQSEMLGVPVDQLTADLPGSAPPRSEYLRGLYNEDDL